MSADQAVFEALSTTEQHGSYLEAYRDTMCIEQSMAAQLVDSFVSSVRHWFERHSTQLVEIYLGVDFVVYLPDNRTAAQQTAVSAGNMTLQSVDAAVSAITAGTLPACRTSLTCCLLARRTGRALAAPHQPAEHVKGGCQGQAENHVRISG